MFQKLAEIYNSTQARTLLLAGLIMTVLFYSNFMKAAIMTVSLLVTAYIINCLVRGNCNMIAWLYVLINVMATYNLLKYRM